MNYAEVRKNAKRKNSSIHAYHVANASDTHAALPLRSVT